MATKDSLKQKRSISVSFQPGRRIEDSFSLVEYILKIKKKLE